MKLWIDECMMPPFGYEWIKSIDMAKRAIIETVERSPISMYDMSFSIESISICEDICEIDSFMAWLNELHKKNQNSLDLNNISIHKSGKSSTTLGVME